MTQHQVLGLCINDRSLPTRCDPGRSDFNLAIRQVHIHVTRGSDYAVRTTFKSGEWDGKPAFLLLENLAVEGFEILERLQAVGDSAKSIVEGVLRNSPKP